MPDPSNSRAWQVEALVRTARAATPLQSEVGQCFISIPLRTEAHQVVPLLSGAFQNWLLEQFYSEHHILPRPSALRDVMQLLQAQTQFGGAPRVSISRRIASAPGKIVLDLYNDAGEVVEISAQGWRIAQNVGVHFRSARSARPLPRPEKPAPDGGQLRSLLQLTPEHFTLCQSWLTAALSPTGPYSVLVVRGPGKSSVAALLRSLIDPGSTPFCPAPQSRRDLYSLASHNWLLAFDRLEHLPAKMSRQLVRLSAGETFAARDRASDPEPFHVFLQRPILLTTSAALPPELAASAITIDAPVDVVADERLRPAMLGALCDAVSAAMAPSLVEKKIAVLVKDAQTPGLSVLYVTSTAPQRVGMIPLPRPREPSRAELSAAASYRGRLTTAASNAILAPQQ